MPQVGLGICYDLRFPELSQALQRDGAHILTYPSAFTVATGAAHWEVVFTGKNKKLHRDKPQVNPDLLYLFVGVTSGAGNRNPVLRSGGSAGRPAP